MMDRLENFDEDELSKYIKPPKIKIFGVGGAGNNIKFLLLPSFEYSRKFVFSKI